MSMLPSATMTTTPASEVRMPAICPALVCSRSSSQAIGGMNTGTIELNSVPLVAVVMVSPM